MSRYIDNDREIILLERLESKRDDMPNEEKYWLLDAGLADWCFTFGIGHGSSQTNFTQQAGRGFLCLTQKGKDRLAQLRSANQ